MYVYIHMYMFIYIYIHMYMFIYIYIHMYIYTHIYVCVFEFAYVGLALVRFILMKSAAVPENCVNIVDLKDITFPRFSYHLFIYKTQI